MTCSPRHGTMKPELTLPRHPGGAPRRTCRLVPMPLRASASQDPLAPICAVLRRLHKVLTRRVSWRGCRRSLRQALSGRDAGPSGRHLLTAPKPGEVLPAMPPFQLRAARKDLADILDEVSGARRV